MRDTYNNFKVVAAIDPVVDVDDDAVADGTTVDLQGYNSCLLIASIGIEGDTFAAGLRTEFFVEHAEDDGAGSPAAWEKAADADLLNSVTSGVADQTGTFGIVDANTESPAVFKTGYIGGRRFVRVQRNNIGTHTNGTPTSAVAVLGHPSYSPVA